MIRLGVRDRIGGAFGEVGGLYLAAGWMGPVGTSQSGNVRKGRLRHAFLTLAPSHVRICSGAGAFPTRHEASSTRPPKLSRTRG